MALALGGLAVASPAMVTAQERTGTSRTALIEQAQAEKATKLHPYEPGKGEQIMDRVEDYLTTGLTWHPFFVSAYAGGGFTLGAGYLNYLSSFSTLDVRGSITFSGYKRIEAEFRAPRLFDRRGVLTLLGGWREATSVGFYGIGIETSKDDRANYSFRQPYGQALLEFWPARRLLMFRGGVELSQWEQRPGSGTSPSVEEIYTPQTLTGLGAKPTYIHTEGTAALDWRTSAGYSRRGGYYGITAHNFDDRDNLLGFQQVEYDLIQHLPIGRDVWVLSLHGHVETTYTKDDQQIPFFMLPSLGGGSSLRGFASWRFRDRHALLLQAEWRVLANRFLDAALFYDAGKVTARRSDLDFDNLKSDYGIGFRLHGPAATPLRIELAKSNEGLVIVFSSKASF